MTNDQILALRVGDYIDHHTNGRVINLEVMAIRATGRCVNEQSGAYGHAYACLTLNYTGSSLTINTAIESDEYGNGEGYPSHNAEGDRLRGWQLVGHNACLASV